MKAINSFKFVFENILIISNKSLEIKNINSHTIKSRLVKYILLNNKNDFVNLIQIFLTYDKLSGITKIYEILILKHLASYIQVHCISIKMIDIYIIIFFHVISL